MNRLVRLYPLAWRQRYGDELSALLDARPPDPFDVADLLLGAVDAHLHQHGVAHHSEDRKGNSMSLRLAGWAAAVAGGSWALFFAIAGASYANEADYGPAWVLVVLIAGVALLAALAGLSAFQSRYHRRSIWVAFLAPGIGIGVLLVGLATLLPTGGSAPEGSLAAAVVYGGLALILVGSVAFAAVTVSTAALSRVAAWTIVVGVVPTLPALFGMMAAVWLVVGGIVFGLGWIGLGIDAIRRDPRLVSADPAAA